MADAWREIRYALRWALARRGFSALVVATLALGVGLNSALFSVVDALLFRAPEVADPARLVNVYSSAPGDLLSEQPLSFPDYEALRDRARSLEGLAASALYPLALEQGDGSRLVMAQLVTGNDFRVLGVAPELGRAITGADDRPDAPNPVAVLSDRAWRLWFGGRGDILGRSIRLNGRLFTVVGVAPRRFRGLLPGLAPDLWLPIHAGAALPTGVTINFGGTTAGVERTRDPRSRWVWVTGRLRDGVSLAGVRAELAHLGLELARELPAGSARHAFVAVAMNDVRVAPGLDRALWAGSLLLLGVFGLGLLLASTNLASLFLARALGRRREIATRLALGAGRGRLLRQLFLEGLVLAVAGGGLGLVLARVSNDALARVSLPLPWPIDLTLAPSLDARVVGFALAISVGAALLFALAPALEATRTDVARMLRELGAGGSAGSANRLRAPLLALQAALALVLLNAGGLALGALARAAGTDPGFATRRAAVVTFSPELIGLSPDRVDRFYARLSRHLEELPGVRSVAAASHLPLTAAINLDKVAAEGDEPRLSVDFASVGPGYFETMGIPLLAGRSFTKTDGPDAPRVAIINETLARRLWPRDPAIGRRLSSGAEVVGVAHDGKYRTLGESPRPFLYNCLGQDRRGTRTLIVRSSGDPQLLLPLLAEALQEVDPRVPARPPRTLAETLADALVVPRLATLLLGLFATLGLLLAALGILGSVAYFGRRRTHEIGVRLALGASRAAIARWLVSRGLTPVAAGLAAGALAASFTAWTLRGFVPRVWPVDLRALLGSGLLLALVGLVAALLPARHAAGLDPAAALRQE
jgi:putative ABC transport system permease protein